MNLGSVVIVVLRLSALHFAARIVLPWVSFALSMSAMPSGEGSRQWLVLSGINVGLLIGTAFLWKLAPSLARAITRGSSQEISLGTLSITDIYMVGFVLMGVWMAATNLDKVASWSFYLLKAAAADPGDAWKAQVNFYDVWSVFGPFIVGSVLAAKARSLALRLTRTPERPSFPESYSSRNAANWDGPEIERLVTEILNEYGLQPDPEGADADLRDIEGFYREPEGWFRVVVERATGKIVGTAGLLRISEGTFELRKMYLRPEHRGKGIGRFLLEEALAECRRRGARKVRLETAAVLKEAVELYRRFGFKVCEETPEVRRCDTVMELELSASGAR